MEMTVYTVYSKVQDNRCKQKYKLIQVIGTVLPAKSNSDVMFCLQSYQGLITAG